MTESDNGDDCGMCCTHHGCVGPSDINMNGVVARSQALSVDALGKAFVAQMSRQAIIADRKFDELDIEQSFANRYQLTGDPHKSQD